MVDKLLPLALWAKYWNYQIQTLHSQRLPVLFLLLNINFAGSVVVVVVEHFIFVTIISIIIIIIILLIIINY